MSEQRLLHGLRQLGSFRRSRFKDVVAGNVPDMNRLLEALLEARKLGEEWAAPLGRVIPMECTFRFTPDTLTDQFAHAAAAFVERIRDGSSLHVRLERRGMEGRVDTPRIEREVADRVFSRAEELGKRLHVSFKDPDYIICAETLG